MTAWILDVRVIDKYESLVIQNPVQFLVYIRLILCRNMLKDIEGKQAIKGFIPKWHIVGLCVDRPKSYALFRKLAELRAYVCPRIIKKAAIDYAQRASRYPKSTTYLKDFALGNIVGQQVFNQPPALRPVVFQSTVTDSHSDIIPIGLHTTPQGFLCCSPSIIWHEP